MRRREFIAGTVASAVALALPAPRSTKLPPISVGPTFTTTDPAGMLRDFEVAEALGARVQASMFISGKLLDPLEIADRIRMNLADADRVFSVVKLEYVDGGAKITMQEANK